MKATFLAGAVATLLYGAAARAQAYPPAPQPSPPSDSTQGAGSNEVGSQEQDDFTRSLGESSPDVGESSPEVGGDVSQEPSSKLPENEDAGGFGNAVDEAQQDDFTRSLGESSPDVGASSPENGGDISQEPGSIQPQ